MFGKKKVLVIGGFDQNSDGIGREILKSLSKADFPLFPSAYSFFPSPNGISTFGSQNVWIRSDNDFIEDMSTGEITFTELSEEISFIIVIDYEDSYYGNGDNLRNISFELLRKIGVPLIVFSNKPNCIWPLGESKLKAPVLILNQIELYEKGLPTMCKIFKKFIEFNNANKLPSEILSSDSLLGRFDFIENIDPFVFTVKKYYNKFSLSISGQREDTFQKYIKKLKGNYSNCKQIVYCS